MKRLLAVSAFTLTLVGLVCANNTRTFSPLVHDAWIKSEAKAEVAADGGDYYHALALLSGGIYTNGVTIALNESTLGRNQVKARNAYSRATQYWENALGADCPLRFVTGNQPAQVSINLVDTIPGDGEELGLIEIKKNYLWTKSSYTCNTKSSISIMRSFDKTVLSEDEMTEVMAHEIGHLLGLADVETPGFLMGPMDRERLTHGPTQSEIDAVVSLRQNLREEFDSVSEMARNRRTP